MTEQCSSVIIVDHGLSWVYNFNAVVCPECNSGKEFIIFEIFASTNPKFNVDEYTAKLECVECNCKWTVARVDTKEGHKFSLYKQEKEGAVL